MSDEGQVKTYLRSNELLSINYNDDEDDDDDDDDDDYLGHEAPQVEIDPPGESVRVEEGSSVVLQCRITAGALIPDIVWSTVGDTRCCLLHNRDNRKLLFN